MSDLLVVSQVYQQFNKQASTPPDAAIGCLRLFFDSDGNPQSVDEDGVVTPVGGGGGAVDSFNGRTGAVVPVAGDYSSFGAMLSVSHASGTYSVDATGYGGIVAGATTGAGITISDITGIPAGRYFIVDIDSQSVGNVTLASESFEFEPLEIFSPALLYTSDGVIWRLVFGSGGHGLTMSDTAIVGVAGSETLGAANQGMAGIFTNKLATSATGNVPSVTTGSEGTNIAVGSITGTDFAGWIAFSASDVAGGVLFGIDFATPKTNQPIVMVFPLTSAWADVSARMPNANVRSDGTGFDFYTGNLFTSGSFLFGYVVIDEVNLAATGGS